MRALASRLRGRITIRRAVEADNGRGGYTTDWVSVATVPAEVTGLDGREDLLEHGLQGISAYRIRIRYREVQQADQLMTGGLTLNVRSVSDPDGRRRELVILADTAGTR